MAENDPYSRLNNPASEAFGKMASCALALAQEARLSDGDRADLAILARQLQLCEQRIRLSSPNLTAPDLTAGLRFLAVQPSSSAAQARRHQLYGLIAPCIGGPPESFDLIKRARMAATWATLATPGMFGTEPDALQLSASYREELDLLLSALPSLVRP